MVSVVHWPVHTDNDVGEMIIELLGTIPVLLVTTLVFVELLATDIVMEALPT